MDENETKQNRFKPSFATIKQAYELVTKIIIEDKHVPLESVEDRTLTKNDIRSFVLRIDLIKNDNLNLGKVVEKLSQYFDRTEQRQVSNFRLSFTTSESELSKEDAFDYVLVSQSKQMTFSETQNSFWLETSSYQNNSIYKDIINKTIEIIKSYSPDIESRRIGLRYINEFECKKPKDINRIYGKRLSTIVKNMTSSDSQIRIIGMEERSPEDGIFLRLQYGVPNKFYPARISTYDLLLDIDSYTNIANNVSDWEQTIRILNHAAYNAFKSELNEQFLEQLK